jgi:plastocyanin
VTWWSGVVVLVSAACSAAVPREGTTASECFYDCPPVSAETYIYDCPPAAKSKNPSSAPLPSGKLGPAGEKVQLLREAAGQLEKALTALAGGNKRHAEQLFSTAELLAPDELASLGPIFREGAPPRVTTPLVAVDPAAKPQPIATGSSEAEDEIDPVEAPKSEVGSLTGAVKIGDGATGFGLVTLEPIGRSWKPRVPKHHIMEQRDREFRPRVMAIAVGSSVAFPNSDAFFHNVFSISPQAAFDLGMYKPGNAREYTFTKEGIIRIGCNIHANMSAFVVVVAAPAYVVTDEQGRFAFRSLAPGKYTLKAWSIRSRAPVTRTVTINAGKNEIAVGVAADAPAGPMPDKFGAPRPPDPVKAR